jgi:hypothetical protein
VTTFEQSDRCDPVAGFRGRGGEISLREVDGTLRPDCRAIASTNSYRTRFGGASKKAERDRLGVDAVNQAAQLADALLDFCGAIV